MNMPRPAQLCKIAPAPTDLSKVGGDRRMEGIPENFTQAQLLQPLLSMHLDELLSARELVSRSLGLRSCKTGQ